MSIVLPSCFVWSGQSLRMLSCLVLLLAEGSVRERHSARPVEVSVFANPVDLELVRALESVGVIPAACAVGYFEW